MASMVLRAQIRWVGFAIDISQCGSLGSEHLLDQKFCSIEDSRSFSNARPNVRLLHRCQSSAHVQALHLDKSIRLAQPIVAQMISCLILLMNKIMLLALHTNQCFKVSQAGTTSCGGNALLALWLSDSRTVQSELSDEIVHVWDVQLIMPTISSTVILRCSVHRGHDGCLAREAFPQLQNAFSQSLCQKVVSMLLDNVQIGQTEDGKIVLASCLH